MPDPARPRFRRIVPRPPREVLAPGSPPRRAGALWQSVKSYLGFANAARLERIESFDALGRFLDSRASYVAQTSLYGYLRTRAGMRYPELFDDDPFVRGINIAKWHVWLDCLADLAVHAGGRMAKASPSDAWRIGRMMTRLVKRVIDETSDPEEAGELFPAHVEQVFERIEQADWFVIGAGEDEAAFTASPDGLVRWAPVIDELKKFDEEIVRNSVRFRWQEIRRELTTHLDVKALLTALPGSDALLPE